MHRSNDTFINARVNVPVNGPSLKHGFQWLREPNTIDVVVDKEANASFLERLVFKYDYIMLHKIM